MVHGILQFTPSIAFRYVLHRCKSRDIRCRESFLTLVVTRRPDRMPSPEPAGRAETFGFLGAFRAGVLFLFETGRRPRTAGPSPPRCLWTRSRVNPGLCGIDNDPSAGSPTETLLRLLLPLNDKVQWTSHNVAGSEPPTSPRSEHFTGPFNR
ncbi:hypothetical protein S83_022961 [Arachis hypogaea]